MKLVRQNLGLKVLALVLALCAWSIVRVVGTPTGETPAQRVFTKPVTLTPPEQPDLMGEIKVQEVSVTLRGKRTVLERIAPGQISAEVDASKRPAGYFMAKVNVLAPGGAEVTEVEPSHVWVQVSRRRALQVPVRVEVVGQASEGYQVAVPRVEPPRVRVVGPQDEVERVAAVVAPVNLGGATSTLSTRALTLEAVDASGSVVSDVEIQSSGVDVTVPVSALPKDHLARVDTRRITVQGSEGWTYSTRVEPSEVTLEGAPDSRPPETVETDPVVFRHSPEPQTREVRVQVPQGFRILGRSTVRVTVIPARQGAQPDPG